MKKTKFFSATLLSIVFLLWGTIMCAAPPSRTISLVTAGHPDTAVAYTKLIESFKTDNPNIIVNHQHFDSLQTYHRELGLDGSEATAVNADVLLLEYQYMPALATAGQLQPIEPFLAVDTQIDTADFYPNIIKVHTYEDQLWCLPQTASSLMVYYNRDLFDAAGAPYPFPGWTRTQFIELLRLLTQDTDGDGETDQYGLGLHASIDDLLIAVRQQGDTLFDNPQNPSRLRLDAPEVTAVLQQYTQLNPYILYSTDLDDHHRYFLEGKVAMIVADRRIVPLYRNASFNWDVTLLPRQRRRSDLLTDSTGFCMTAATNQSESAWRFIEFASTSTGQRILLSGGHMVPSRVDVATGNAFLNDIPPTRNRAYLEALSTSQRLPQVRHWYQIENTVKQQLQFLLTGQQSVAETAVGTIELTEPYFDTSQE